MTINYNVLLYKEMISLMNYADYPKNYVLSHRFDTVTYFPYQTFSQTNTNGNNNTTNHREENSSHLVYLQTFCLVISRVITIGAHTPFPPSVHVFDVMVKS